MTKYCVAILGLLLAFGAAGEDSSLEDTTQAFLSSLDDDARQKVQYPFNDELRLDWHFIPRQRKGLSFKDLDAGQQRLLHGVLKAGLSEQGYSKAETVRKLESVLREMEGRDFRDPDRYYLLVFGEPSPKDPWALRYEGHHLSFSWTLIDGRIVSSSPQFIGSNPAEVRIEGEMKGVRVLEKEEDLGRALLHSLDDTQRAAAVLSSDAPNDILTSAQREVSILEDLGVAYGKMTPEQQGLVISIIEELAFVQPEAIARQRLSEVRAAGLDDVKFAWMGGANKGEPHYYRIQGSTFLIEYDNTQNNVNHVHTVWRDFDGDFGRDALKEHYAAFASEDHPQEHRH